MVAGRGAGERRHLPRFHLCGFVPHTHHNTLPPRYHHRHCHCHRHSLTSRQCFLHHHWHYYCHVTNFEKVNNMVMRKPADFSVSRQPFQSPLFKMFDLKFQNHKWCRPLSPFTGGAKLSNCKKIFCRPPVVVVQHDHHQRQCHTCHTQRHCHTLRRDCKWVLGALFPSFFVAYFALHIYIFCSTFVTYFVLHTAHFFK